MRTDDVALVPSCVECGTVWRPTDRNRWRAYPASTSISTSRGNFVFYCPRCAEEHLDDA